MRPEILLHGDLQPNGKPWTIGIANPNAAHELFSYSMLQIWLLPPPEIMKNL